MKRISSYIFTISLHFTVDARNLRGSRDVMSLGTPTTTLMFTQTPTTAPTVSSAYAVLDPTPDPTLNLNSMEFYGDHANLVPGKIMADNFINFGNSLSYLPPENIFLGNGKISLINPPAFAVYIVKVMGQSSFSVSYWLSGTNKTPINLRMFLTFDENCEGANRLAEFTTDRFLPESEEVLSSFSGGSIFLEERVYELTLCFEDIRQDVIFGSIEFKYA